MYGKSGLDIWRKIVVLHADGGMRGRNADEEIEGFCFCFFVFLKLSRLNEK